MHIVCECHLLVSLEKQDLQTRTGFLEEGSVEVCGVQLWQNMLLQKTGRRRELLCGDWLLDDSGLLTHNSCSGAAPFWPIETKRKKGQTYYVSIYNRHVPIVSIILQVFITTSCWSASSMFRQRIKTTILTEVH